MSADEIPLPDDAPGSLWLCALRDVAHDPEALLRATGASLIVCLNERHELERREPAYLEWLRANQPGRAMWFPTRNYDAQAASEVRPVLDRVVARLRAGEGVIVHCAMGQGRAGTFAVCVLLLLGVPADDALRQVATHRAFAGPAARSQWALVESLAAEIA